MIKNGSASQNPDLALGLSIWVFWGACLLALVAAAPGHAAELLAELKGVGPQSASGPSRDPGYSSVIEVQGTAAGNDFGSAVLEYGAGEFPTEWGTIATLKGPISQGRLGLWETKSVPPGKYSVRLTVYSTAGVFQRAQRLIDLRDWRPDVVIRQALYRLDGGKLMVAVELANQGKQPAPAPIGLTVTGQLDGGAPVRLARWELGSSLPAGGQASKTGTVALPPTMNPGRYALAVILDEEGKIADGDRTNNRWVITPPVELGADLAMTQLKAEMAPDGRSVLIKDLVVNQGALPAAAATVLYYLSTDGTIQSTDTRVGQRPLPALPAGERSAATTPLPLPPGLQTGAYFLLGRVSLGPANNDYWGSSLTLGPDLVVAALSARIDPLQRQLLVTEVVKNTGHYQAGAVSIQYGLVAEGSITRTASTLGQQELAQGVAPGAELRSERAFPLPEGLTGGRYRLVAQIDPLQRVLESHRDNNQAQSDWIVVGYDLAVDEVAAEPSPDGQELRVTDTVRNHGLLPSTGHVTVRYFLQQQENAEAARSDQAGAIGQRVVESGLASGERSTGTVTVRLPEGAFHRRWRVAAQVSAAGAPSGGDAQPNNNRRATASWVNDGVDLAIGKAKAAVSPSGDRLTITESVNNYGRAALGQPVRVVYALSVTGAMDGRELVLGHRTVDALPAGGDSTTTTSWPLPAALEPHRYFVIIQLDPDRRVAEVKRDNNTAAGSSIAIGPQPVLEGLKAQLKPDGAAMAVTVTVANRGNRTMTGPQPVTFSVARDEAGKERVMELGRQSMTPLAPGGRATPAFTLSLPASLEPGAYFVTAQLDGAQDAPLAVSPAALAVGPDLASQMLQAELVGQGEQLQVRITDAIANQGNRAVTRPFVVSYLLSTDWRLDRSDLLLGQRRIEQLPAGEAQKATLQFHVPVQTIETGRYFVLSRIDLEGAIEESNRSNNLRPTVEGLLIERLEKRKKGPDLPDVISAPQQQTGAVIP